MRKNKIFITSIIVICIVAVSLTVVKNKADREELTKVKPVILANMFAPGCEDSDELKSNSKIIEYHNNQPAFISLADVDKIHYSVYGENLRFYLVSKDGFIKIFNTDDKDRLIDTYEIMNLPVAMYTYKDSLFVLSAEGILFYIDFYNEKLVQVIDAVEMTNTPYVKPEIYIDETGIVFQKKGEKGWYLFNKEDIRKISNSENCYGFTDENTLLFSDSYGLLCVLYQKNVEKHMLFNIRPILAKTGIFNGAVSKDGKYLFAYYGMNELGSYPTVYDLDSFASIKYCEYEYPTYSIQLIK